MGSDPLKEENFEPREPKKVGDGSDHQGNIERGRCDEECVVCVEERNLLTIDGEQHRKEDKIGLSDGGYDFYVTDACRRQECLDP